MVTTWTDDPLSKAVPCKAQHINELRAAIEAVPGIYTPPWGFGGRVSSGDTIKAQHMLDLRAAIGPGGGPGTVWNVRGINAGPMLWNETVPGATTSLSGVLRATHVDDLRRWFNTSETGVGNYQFPHVRPMIFGMNPSWREWQQNPPPGYTNDAMMAKIRDAGGTCIRSGIDWASIEPIAPVNGVHTYYWNAKSAPGAPASALDYDANIQIAQKYGLLWVADVGTAPNWATGNTSSQMPPDSAHEADFQAFITAVAQHYLGQIRHYEFNNEPDNGFAWHNPDPATYVHFLQIFYNAIKAVDPTAWVSTGGVENLTSSQPNVGLNFVQAIYSNGGRPYFDAVAGHPYDPNNGPMPTSGISSLRALVNGAGDYYKPLWLTEYGWTVANRYCTATNGIDPATQSSYLQSALSFFASPPSPDPGVTVATFQIIADITPGTCMGLLDQDLDATARADPAYSTFSTFQKPTT